MLRFTIRDLLWLMVVAGMGISWFVDHQSGTAAKRRVQGLEGVIEHEKITWESINEELGKEGRGVALFPSGKVRFYNESDFKSETATDKP
jgi:hypothetical protein